MALHLHYISEWQDEQRRDFTFPVRVQECGSLLKRGSKLVWSQYRNQFMEVQTYRHDEIAEGDTLSTLSRTALAATPRLEQLLCVPTMSRTIFGRQSSC
jgi:hypothetical protein